MQRELDRKCQMGDNLDGVMDAIKDMTTRRAEIEITRFFHFDQTIKSVSGVFTEEKLQAMQKIVRNMFTQLTTETKELAASCKKQRDEELAKRKHEIFEKIRSEKTNAEA